MISKTLNIEECPVKVKLREQVVHLITDHNLVKLVNTGWAQIDNLCDVIFETYYSLFHKKLNISKNSLVMEILGHVYAYRVLETLRKIFPFKIMSGLLKRLSHSAWHIDCGERSRDQNRWVWDVMRWIKPLMFLFVHRKN